MCRWPLLLLLGLLSGAAAGGSGRPLPHRTLLDPEGKYWLNWGPQGGRLAFRLEVRTAGYVGFGFSPTGAMAAADIVVGGVAHGRPYLQVSASCRVPTLGRRGYGVPRATRLSFGSRLDAVATTQPQPATRSTSRSAPAPQRLPRLDSQLPRPTPRRFGPGKPSTVTPGSLPSLKTFLPRAPHLSPTYPPAAYLPSSPMGKERDPGFGDLTGQLWGLEGPEGVSGCWLAVMGGGGVGGVSQHR